MSTFPASRSVSFVVAAVFCSACSTRSNAPIEEATASPSDVAAPTATADPVATVAVTIPSPTVAVSVAAPTSPCPTATLLEALTIVVPPKLGPFDPPAFTFTRAMVEQGGKKLSVMITNKDWSTMTGPDILEGKGDAIVNLSFYGMENQVVAKTYGAGFEYRNKEKVYATLNVKGAVHMLPMKGSATILSLTDTSVCGTFDLEGKVNGDNRIKGTFVAPILK